MERLTEKNDAGTHYFQKCFEKCGGIGTSSKCDNCEYMTSICEKLGFYEDTEEQGLIPNYLKEAKKLIEKTDSVLGKTALILETAIQELAIYELIGTTGECAAAVSYQNPATMIFPKGNYAICPICDHGVRITDKYCSNCGQKLTREGWKETKKGETVG